MRPTSCAISTIPPTVADLEQLMELLGHRRPRLMMRTGETVYAELALAEQGPAELLEAIVAHPILLERPIFVATVKRSSPGRPNGVLELL